MYVALITLMLAAAPPASDTLVVCPDNLREALDEWLDYRRAQGHHIAVIKPPATAAALQSMVRQAAKSGKLKCLVLMGDVAGGEEGRRIGNAGIPTNLVPANINTRWGSTPTIATDTPYADIDGDGSPDLMVGRIPADSPIELRHAIRKVVRYERESEDGAWQRRLDVVAGIGGFGVVADALVEAAGRQVFQQAVPAGFEMRHTSAKTASLKSNHFRETACKHLTDGSLAWIYLGHGLPTELDRVPTPGGNQPIMSIADVPQLRCQQCRPLAVLVACYTGAFDAHQECLAEALALAEEGPIAVIAATRVTMPYGNTVLGYELLRACFHDRPTSLGEALRLAQRRTLTANEIDKFRPSLDSLAQGLSPPPVDLSAERREHVQMYHLFGDPLLRLRLSPAEESAAERRVAPFVEAAIANEP
jgi:hypothetical protein